MRGRPPIFLRFRTSTTFIAFTVGLGVLTDLSGYGLVVPVVPYRLQALGYDGIGAKTGWLVAAYAGGLIISSPPIAYAGNLIKSRRWPLVFVLLFMIGAIILFMETASFTGMVISRILQGISGTGIWTLGLSLITDSVPEDKVGTVMGNVMIGFSVGVLIGAPVGGVLYDKLGYRAPFVFALCLLFVDLVLRLLIVEKRDAIKWIQAGVEIPGFEAAGYTPKVVSKGGVLSSAPIPMITINGESDVEEEVEVKRKPSEWNAFLSMLTSPRAITCFALAMLNGIILGGALDVGMVLWLEHQYKLSSLGAGLVFIGAIVPTFVAAPLGGWIADKHGAKWIGALGIVLTAPTLSLLIIRGPLPLFIFFLVMLGISMSFFLTPTMQDLSMIVNLTPGLPATACYGMLNMADSIGAFIGPIVGGQLIESLGIRKGWIALCAVTSALALALVPAVVLFLGGDLRRRSPKQPTRMFDEGSSQEDLLD